MCWDYQSDGILKKYLARCYFKGGGGNTNVCLYVNNATVYWEGPNKTRLTNLETIREYIKVIASFV